MNWNNWRVKNKIAGTFTLLFFVAIFGLGGLTYVHTEREYTSRTLELVHTSLAQMTTTVELYLQDMERLSLAIFSDPIIQRILRQSSSEYGVQYDNNEMMSRMVQFTSPWPYIQGVYLFADDGRVFSIAKGSGISSDYSILQEPWYSKIREGKADPFIYWPTGPESTVLRNPQQVFSLIRPINDFSEGKKLGYLKIDMQAQVMKSTLFKATLAKEDGDLPLRYMLLDSEANIMYDSEELLTGKKLPNELESVLTHQEGSVKWSEIRYLFSKNKSNYNKWTLLALAPNKDVVNQSDKIRSLILLLGIITLVVIAAASYMLAAGISRPLTSLIKTMKRVELGDFKVRAEDSGQQDEIGRLSRVFNMMLESVDKLIHRVYLLDIRQKDAKLMALQAQINPHMLFNTLNSMKALSRKQQAHDVADMAENLADLFRYSMKGWNRPVTLAEELEHVLNYVRIQEVRYRDRLKFECYIPDTLLRAEIIKLSIQPLVENAIIHGIEPKVEGGILTLSAQVQPELESGSLILMITVSDSGVGMPPDRVRSINEVLEDNDISMDELPETKSGIGLLNIHKRIRLLFGAPYGLHLESDEHIGTIVSIHIPYNDNMNHDKE
ncbi:cache domain-containing sensor histidine kinase [Cohnella abietis]|uniref:Histidine kinase n=1 Tax=Cohnella abietis TaxID=2507935 RepID=A0A3T1DED6_9BACL|nr:sensor histidine kinase [Cohnella abietis]BBI36521.1 histidine kinase [Cohnella abietis]